MSEDASLGTWPDDPPKGATLIQQIRAVSSDSGKVFFSRHAQEQLLMRGYSDRDVIAGFRIGDVVGDVTPGNKPGEWVCEVIFPARQDRGSRNIGVITIVQRGVRLFLKTVMWKDKR